MDYDANAMIRYYPNRKKYMWRISVKGKFMVYGYKDYSKKGNAGRALLNYASNLGIDISRISYVDVKNKIRR